MSPDRMQGALGAVFLLAAVGLFAPDEWRTFLFGVVLLVAVVGLYDTGPYREARDERRRRAEL